MNRKHSKKIRNLVAICSLCAIMLSVSTYAWFVGMKTVNVSRFEIDIATTEGLLLSLDGRSWKYQITPGTDKEYVGNTNQWLKGEGEGLIPMSSVGEVDATSSTMKLYQKGSLTATEGGYRLMASRVNNNTKNDDNQKYYEGKGYIAFDLFIMNQSGDEYYVKNEPLNEEAIYLTVNSTVKQSKAGVDMDKTGIENSVRVGFAQIARVNAELDLTSEDKTTSAAVITAMDCAGDGDIEGEAPLDHVTGICRNAAIWEPNDTKHVQNAINWYNKSCLLRTGEDVYTPGSTCNTVANGTAYATYAINKELSYDAKINVYDGEDYNGYSGNTTSFTDYIASPINNAAKLVAMSGIDENGVENGYFTDTMKNLKGTDRPQFMSLAPNSITKVRVYVWLEGQDVDNYDFASLGQQISINFGFTKERYTENDVNYDGPSTDITPTNGQ